ncbi:hypothetical protein [Paracidobacterium acidisoli]|uniref:Glycosyltransferase RgtA/B/C/D-like domain-containing protein n=1 Tax=Paracidobacterium acidisoli TaxID=2303751 RepID=A0A372IR05_9BACT|nr:hypothetical protein [Paracidobacterium acidisoli]MBT9330239.1 hypothetical protein [Paracidobacterium acidisoli]
MQDRWTRSLGVCLFALALAAQPLLAYFFHADTWDDSAITAAYAHTFAHTGVVEATPGSGIVEGYSTTLWMLVLAAVAKVTATPMALLGGAKVLSCLLNVLNIVLLRAVVRRWGRPDLADYAAGAFGLMELTVQESINGMEDPLMLFLLLAAVYCLRSRSVRGRSVFLLAGALFVLCRHEAFVLIAPLLLLVRPVRRAIVAAAVWFGVLGTATVIRRKYFGALLPNTIIAKRHFPYSMPTRHQELMRHLAPAETLARGLAMVLLVLIYVAVRNRRELWRLLKRMGQLSAPAWLRETFADDDVKVAGVLTTAGLLLDFGVGKNWGPPERELYSALPFLIYLLLRLTFRLAGTASLRRQACALLFVLLAYREVRNAQRLASPYAPLYMPMVTVHAIAGLVPPVEQIRTAAGLQDLTFAVPDVGGVMLFGDHLRVMDLGLLCDRTLAQKGYAIAPHYILDVRRPEVIELHSFWTDLTGLEAAPQFYREYVEMIIDQKRFFVRRDVFERFAAETATRSFQANGHPLTVDDVMASGKLSYPDYAAGDLAINRKFGTYAVFRGGVN